MKEKGPLKKVVQGLIRRRLQHQSRINKLLDPKYLEEQTNSSLRHPHGELSEVLRNLDNEEPQQQESIGNLGNHVNLLATVSLKTEYFLAQKQPMPEPGYLYTSLTSKFPQTDIFLAFGQTIPSVCFGIQRLVEYLKDQELVQGLFSFRQNGNCKEYFGTCFINGKHSEIHLSKEALLPQQEHLIVDFRQKVKAIGWLLLTRVLLKDPSQEISFPIALQKLFSFPHKTFQIRDSLQLIRFNDFFTNSTILQKESGLSFTFLGQNQEGKTKILNLPQGRNIKVYSTIIRQFPIIHTLIESDLPVKSLPLSCLNNHFVVITISSKTPDYYFFAVNGETGKQNFRVCLLDYEGNIVKHEIIRSSQFFFCKLAEQQYELYVSPQSIQQVQDNAQQSFELVKESQVNFHFWVQGKSVVSRNGNLQVQIRLKQQYNRYTSKIGRNYLKTIKQQPQYHPSQQKVHIERYHLQVMNLVIDKFIFSFHPELQIKYKQTCLCDEYFQDQAIIIHPNDYVTHYCRNEIEAIISIEKGQDNIQFTITSHFL